MSPFEVFELLGLVSQARRDGKITFLEYLMLAKAGKAIIEPLPGNGDRIFEVAMATLETGAAELSDGAQLKDIKVILQATLDSLPETWD